MNPSIRTKFMGILALLIVAMALVGWQGIAGIDEMNGRIKSIYEHQFVPSRIIAGANNDLIAWNRAILNFLLAENAEKREEYEQIISRHQDALLRDLEALSGMGNRSGQETAILGNMQKEVQRAIPVRDHLLLLSREERTAEAREVLHAELRPIVDAMDEHMAAFLGMQETQLLEAQKVAEDRTRDDLMRIFLILGSVFITSLLLSLLMSEAIIRSI